VGQRRVLPRGALGHGELLGTAREHAQRLSGVGVEPGWWVAAEVLQAQRVGRAGAAAAVGDPHGVLAAGAVAARVVAADLRARRWSVDADRPWVGAVSEAAEAVMVFDGRLRRGAGLRLLLAVTDAAEDDPDVGIAEAVATVLTARTKAEHQLAVVTLTGLLDADPRRYRPVLASGWVLVFGPMLLGVLDEVSDQLGLLRTGKPPLRAAALRNAQRATVQQLFATGQVSTRTLKAQAGVTTATIQRWIHQPPPAVTLQGVGLTTAQCAARAGIKPATWRSYVHRGQAPPARGGTANMPLWEDTDVDLFLAHRPGPGTRSWDWAPHTAHPRSGSTANQPKPSGS